MDRRSQRTISTGRLDGHGRDIKVAPPAATIQASAAGLDASLNAEGGAPVTPPGLEGFAELVPNETLQAMAEYAHRLEAFKRGGPGTENWSELSVRDAHFANADRLEQLDGELAEADYVVWRSHGDTPIAGWQSDLDERFREAQTGD